MSVAVKFTVKNTTAQRRKTEIKLAINGGVAKSVTPWNAAYSPGEYDNARDDRLGREMRSFRRSKHSERLSYRACRQSRHRLSTSWVVYDLILRPNSRDRSRSSIRSAGRAAEAENDFDSIIADSFDAVATATTDEWNAQLKAAFTPGQRSFSGHVPTLVTTDENVKRIYHSAVMTALYFRRTTPHSVYGTTYVTLMPRYWETATFLWDISPECDAAGDARSRRCCRRMMETWMTVDVHQHFGTEFLTGAGIGPWYSVNDYAMSRMAKEYLRWTGDKAWLDKKVGGKTVFEHLVSYAEHWRELNTNKHGLADYGGVLNLLEAVSSYVHEVAGLKRGQCS